MALRRCLELGEQVGAAEAPFDDLADERRDDRVIERVELIGGELGGGLDGEGLLRDHLGAMTLVGVAARR